MRRATIAPQSAASFFSCTEPADVFLVLPRLRDQFPVGTGEDPPAARPTTLTPRY